MDTAQLIVNLNSQEPERLIAFYKDVVGLTPRFEITAGAFTTGSAAFPTLIIEGHSRLAGPTAEPERVLLNFVVDDAEGEQRRLEAQGVEFIRPATYEAGVGMFATFLDPDGNYCQLVEFRE